MQFKLTYGIPESLITSCFYTDRHTTTPKPYNDPLLWAKLMFARPFGKRGLFFLPFKATPITGMVNYEYA